MPENPDSTERLKYAPLVRTKLNNFLDALGARPANLEQEGDAYALLEDTLGINLEEAVDHYIKYSKMPRIKQYMTGLYVKHAIDSNADNYLNTVLPQNIKNMQNMFEAPAFAYQQSILNGLSGLIQNKALGPQVIKHLMDFRTLDQPIPFVSSKINWLPMTK